MERQCSKNERDFDHKNKQRNVNNLKIAISGELGGGKTALGKLICERLGFSLISIGIIQRELAAKYGMNTVEFNKYMETHPEIDYECDKKVEEYGKSDANLILDSRLAWHFIPHAFKIYLVVNIEVAAQRIFNDSIRKNENNRNIEDTIENIRIRSTSEHKRFKEQYNVDLDNYNNYNLVIDTTHITPQRLSNFIVEKFNVWKEHANFPNSWLSPKNIFPMRDISKQWSKDVEEIKRSMLHNGFRNTEPLVVIKWENSYFMYDGHKRCAAAVGLEMDLIPVSIINLETNILPNGQPINEYIKDNYALKNIHDWEDINNFRLPK